MNPPINPTEPLHVTLEAQQWNLVLALVGEGAYRAVAAIMQTVESQLHAQANRSDNVIQMEAGQ